MNSITLGPALAPFALLAGSTITNVGNTLVTYAPGAVTGGVNDDLIGVSPGTARRMIRRGQLRNRIVARPGGFAYLVYLPNSWHARFTEHAHDTAVVQPVADEPLVVAGRASWRDRGEAAWSALAQSIERALHPPATQSHLRLVQADGPYARYRRLARKRRWWRF